MMAYIARRYAGWFDGVDDYVEVPHSEDFSNLSEFTVEVFVRDSGYDNPSLYDAIVIKGQYSSTTPFGIFKMYDADAFMFCVGDGEAIADISFGIGSLHSTHLVGLYDGVNIKTYRDGEFKASKSVSVVNWNSLPISIGGGYSGRYFRGDIYLVRIYNRALTDDEIAKLSEDPFDPNNIPRDALVGWWDFNKADWENGILPDLSGNGNDGTMYGVAQKPVLVKRGAGELPEWDLKYEWWSDSIDDTVTVDVNGQFLSNDLSVVWCAPSLYHDDFTKSVVEPYAGGVGHYDDTESAWVVDVGEKGYFFDSGTMEGAFQRLSWWYWEVKVADNTQNVPIFRAELYDDATGELIASVDVMADSYLTDSYISWQVGSDNFIYAFLPNGKYRLLLYSYGNVKFWIKRVIYETSHMYLVYNPSVYFRLYWGVDSGWVSDLRIRDVNGNIYHWAGSLSDGNNVDKPIFQMYAVSLDVQKYRSEGGGVNDYSRSVDGWNMSFTYFNIPHLSNDRTFIGRIHTIMLYDRYLDDTEFADIYSKKFVIDGLLHWWVVREDGYLVDLVTGKEYQIQGNPVIREIYDETGKFNSGMGMLVWNIIKDERGA